MTDHRPIIAHYKEEFARLSETFIYQLLKNHKRYRAIVLSQYAYQNKEVFPLDGVYSLRETTSFPRYLVERIRFKFFSRSHFFEQTLRDTQTKAIHAHFGQLGCLILPTARRLALPLVTSFYGYDVSNFWQRKGWLERYRALFEEGDLCLVLGPNMRQDLLNLGCPAQKIEILPLAVNSEQFQYRRKAAGAKDVINLASCGRLIPKKGMDVTLRALSLIAGDYPRLRLQIMGDGPQRESLQALSAALGLTERVVWHGSQPPARVAEIMREADLFVLASRTDPATGEMEGTPAVLLEAQLIGLPVLSTRHADIPSIVLDEESGLIVPAGDAQALARGLETLLQAPQRWPDMGHAGHAFVRQRHGADRVAARLEDIYARLLRQRT